MNTPQPSEIRARKAERKLHVAFEDGSVFDLPFEYLRCFSPSAEVTGHGGPRLLVAGKENVDIRAIEPVGQYAVRLIFDDGHDSGIYTWTILRDLGENMAENWGAYLAKLESAGLMRGRSHVE